MGLTISRLVAAGLAVIGFLVPAAAVAQTPSPTSPHVVRTTKFTINGDVEEHSVFYQNMFEMTEVNRYIDEGRLVEPFVGYHPGAKVGLLAFQDQESIPKSPYPVTVIFTPDLDGIVGRLQEAGQPVDQLSPSDAHGLRIAITRDPSGNVLEIIERAGIPAVGGAKLIVEDRQKAEEFFVDLFAVSAGQRLETDDFDEVIMNFGGEMFVALFEPKGVELVAKSESPVVAIYTTEFDAVLERVKALGHGYTQLGDRLLFANDPSGNVVEIVRETTP